MTKELPLPPGLRLRSLGEPRARPAHWRAVLGRYELKGKAGDTYWFQGEVPTANVLVFPNGVVSHCHKEQAEAALGVVARVGWAEFLKVLVRCYDQIYLTAAATRDAMNFLRNKPILR